MLFTTNPRFKQYLSCSILAFASGLPFQFNQLTIQAYLASANIDIKTISLLSLIGLPYVLKFLWSGLLDQFHIPLKSKRIGWIFLSQIALTGLLFSLCFISIDRDISLFMTIIFLISFFSAHQDIVIDAYRIEILTPAEQPLGIMLAQYGYRFGMLIAGSFILILASTFSWQLSFAVMALLMLATALYSLYAAPIEAALPQQKISPQKGMPLMFSGCKALLNRPEAKAILSIAILYPLAENLLLFSLLPTFFIQHLHCPINNIATYYSGLCIFMSILGSWIAKELLRKFLLHRVMKACLLSIFLIILAFIVILSILTLSNMSPYAFGLLAACYFCHGISTSSLQYFFILHCEKNHTAEQYAYLTAISSISRYLSGPLIGSLILYYGWSSLFFTSAIAVLPALTMLQNKGIKENLNHLFLESSKTHA
jgi:MFS transporter, PAT family, beta-lactamase induction signal transducer AmpG